MSIYLHHIDDMICQIHCFVISRVGFRQMLRHSVKNFKVGEEIKDFSVEQRNLGFLDAEHFLWIRRINHASGTCTKEIVTGHFNPQFPFQLTLLDTLRQYVVISHLESFNNRYFKEQS